MQCSACGTQLPDNSKFCDICGKRVGSSNNPYPQKESNWYENKAFLAFLSLIVIGILIVPCCFVGISLGGIVLISKVSPITVERVVRDPKPVSENSILIPIPTLPISIQSESITSSIQTPAFIPTREIIPISTISPPPTLTSQPVPTQANIQSQVQSLGPILNKETGLMYSVEITLKDVKWSNGKEYSKPKTGNIFVNVYLGIRNLGPGELRSLYSSDFNVRDSKGAVLRENSYIGENCDFPLVDLPPNSSTDGCVAFEVPTSGRIEFIYAPYNSDRFGSGRYIFYVLRGE